MTDTVDLLQRGYPKTKEEWWSLANHYKSDLLDLVKSFHPLYRRGIHPLSMTITASRAEAVCEMIREKVRKETVDDPVECFNQFLDQKSEGLVHLLNEVWFGIPESMAAHDLPGFHILCNLCSESYCLEPEEE